MPNLVSETHAGGQSHWGLRWTSHWGHEPLYWVCENAKRGLRDASVRSHWGLRWSSLWGPRYAALGS
eukprot:4555351-Pyramimonas_sp.AAC.1